MADLRQILCFQFLFDGPIVSTPTLCLGFLMFILVKATKELMSDKDENVKLKRRLKVKREKW